MSWKVLITARAAEEVGQPAYQLLRQAGCELVLPPKFGPLSADDVQGYLAGCDAALCSADKYTPAVLEHANAANIKCLSRWGVGYDVVREVEHLPNPAHDDRALPDAVMSIIGSMVSFDHLRQRMYLIESVPVLQHADSDVERLYAEAVYEFPVKKGVPVAGVVAGFGLVMTTVRFSAVRYCLATRCTSAAVMPLIPA